MQNALIVTTGTFWSYSSFFKFKGFTVNTMKITQLSQLFGRIFIQVVQTQKHVIYIVKDSSLKSVFEGELQSVSHTPDVNYSRKSTFQKADDTIFVTTVN